MSRSSTSFRQTDLTRAIKGARNAGVNVARAEIGKDGKIVIVIGESAGVHTEVNLTPEDELERWRRNEKCGLISKGFIRPTPKLADGTTIFTGTHGVAARACAVNPARRISSPATTRRWRSGRHAPRAGCKS